MIKLIIFDFDGVIITGSNEGYFTCYHNALVEVGVVLDPKEERRRILKKWGQPYRNELKELLIEHPELLDDAVKAYEKCYYSPIFTSNLKLIQGSDSVLKNLSTRFKIAIASGMMRSTMDKLIKKFKIDLFDIIITNEDVTKHTDLKPAPFMIDKIREELDFSKEETIMVGDAENDIQMAKNAGVTPISVLTGHINKKDADTLGVKHIIPDITHLPNLLQKI